MTLTDFAGVVRFDIGMNGGTFAETVTIPNLGPTFRMDARGSGLAIALGWIDRVNAI